MKVSNSMKSTFYVSVRDLFASKTGPPAQIQKIEGGGEAVFNANPGVGHLKISRMLDFKNVIWEGFVPMSSSFPLEIRPVGIEKSNSNCKVRLFDGDTYLPSFSHPNREFFGSTSRGSGGPSKKKTIAAWILFALLVVLILLFLSRS